MKYLNLIFLYFLLFAFEGQANTSELLSTIPEQDRKDLAYLFYDLVENNHFGYVLFDDKPAALAGYFTLTPWENIIECDDKDGVFQNKWKVWEKWRDRLKIEKYLLIKEPAPFSDCEFIILINKKLFIKLLENHKSIFENILNVKLNPQEFFREIVLGKKTFLESIQNNQTIWGLILGYGLHNSVFFNLRGKVLKYSCLTPLINKTHKLSRISSIQCMVDNQHMETHTLKEKYARSKARLSQIYAKGDFLTPTLIKLTEN